MHLKWQILYWLCGEQKYLEYSVWLIYFNIKVFRKIQVLRKNINGFGSTLPQSNVWANFALIKMKLAKIEVDQNEVNISV